MRQEVAAGASWVALAGLLLACTPAHKDAPASKPLMKNGFVVGNPNLTLIDATTETGTQHEEMPILDASGFIITTVTKKVTVTTKPDPDQEVIASARESAASCFNGIQNGPPTLSGVIRVTVVPSGSVTRTEATASTTDPGVISCLEGVGGGLRFSDKSDKPTADIRSYAIDVMVTRNH